MPRPRSLLSLLTLLLTLPLWSAAALAGPDPAVVQQLAARMGRKPARLVRDQARLAPLRKVESYHELRQGAAPLTTARTKERWRPRVEGPFSIKVDLANGCLVEGQAKHYQLPESLGGPRSKLHQLVISRAGKRLEIQAPSEASITLGSSNYFDTNHNTVTWNGPSSRFELLLLGHELGHRRDFASFSEAERQAISAIYDKTNDNKPLTAAEKSVLVSFERRAWAKALQTYRAHRRQGLDYLSDGPAGKRTPTSEIFATVHSFLKSYYDVPVAE